MAKMTPAPSRIPKRPPTIGSPTPTPQQTPMPSLEQTPQMTSMPMSTVREQRALMSTLPPTSRPVAPNLLARAGCGAAGCRRP